MSIAVPNHELDVSPYTTAGAAALGQVRGSGMVAPWNELQPYGGVGVTRFAPVEQVQNAQGVAELPPDSFYVSRALFGGVTAFPSPAEYADPVPFTGGFTLLAHRTPLALIEGEQMSGDTPEQRASWRAAPPVVQVCAKAFGEVSNA